MDNFAPYEKMPEGLHKLGLDLAATKALDKVEWAVTEKIHGANFSFTHTQGQLGYAKRKEPLRWTDDFFAFQLVATQLDDAVMALMEAVGRIHPYVQCTVYGELYGGAYPHPDVPADTRVQPVQTGIWYTPSIAFMAFDIAITAEDGQRRYLDFAEVLRLCAGAGMPCAQPLRVCRLHEAMAYDTRFDSRIPAMHGLPPIVPNLVEGIVVKPMRNLVLPTTRGDMRPIFKVKNREFAEEQFHEAQPWSYHPEGASLTERLQFLLPELWRYITANRYHSARSKIGNAAEAVIAAIAADVLESFREANAGLLDELAPAEWDWLAARVAAEALRRNYANGATD